MKTKGSGLQIIQKIFRRLALVMLIVVSILTLSYSNLTVNFNECKATVRETVKPVTILPDPSWIAKADTSNPYIYIVGRPYAWDNIAIVSKLQKNWSEETGKQGVSKKNTDAINIASINSILNAETVQNRTAITIGERGNI